MKMEKYLTFPTWLRPEIIPGLPFRWYGLMYLVAFALTFIVMHYQLKSIKMENAGEKAINLFFWCMLGLLMGGRLFAVLFYSPGGFYLRNPWLIFWPFRNGGFVGIQGMSYHGGLLGVAVAAFLYLRVNKLDILEWMDGLSVSAPLGYTFGRLGNFINGELYGRVTSSRLGMLFPQAHSVPTSEPWVREAATAVGIDYGEAAFVNLPRHPSQLYEAFFEGVFLWAVLWFTVRKWRPFKGAITACYLFGYGLVRFLIEYTRQPDANIGYVLRLSKKPSPIELFVTPFNLSLGQVLCLLMIISGIICWFSFSNRAKREAEIIKHTT